MLAQRCNGVDIECIDDDLVVFTTILLLLYADDTAIVAENEIALQHSLDHFFKFCKDLKLCINYAKTKVLIFGVRNKERFNFHIDNNTIEIVDTFKNLGVILSSSRSFLKPRMHVIQQARKALFLLYKRIRHFNLSLKLQIKLFDHTIVPILLYGREVWGFENTDVIEKVHNEFLRKISNLRKSTPIYILHAELGRLPLEINIKVRMVSFCFSDLLMTGELPVNDTKINNSNRTTSHARENNDPHSYCCLCKLNKAQIPPTKPSHLSSNAREYGPQHEKMSLQAKFLISEKQVLFERVMFPKSNSFYLTGVFKVLCEIWHFYYMYPFNVIAKKNGAKVVHCISQC